MSASGHGALVVGLVGSGIAESLSPALHEREASLLGFDYSYRLFDLDTLDRPPSEVGDLAREAQRQGLRGLNVTHPCKQLVISELDELSPEAAALGAICPRSSSCAATGWGSSCSRSCCSAPRRR